MARILCSDQNHDASKVRALVVDDFEPFRQFTVSTLQTKQEFQVVGEASDGLEAVQKAEELQPELILLDLGLPTLNGFEAARQIRKLAPESKIIFVTQESSLDVVQAGLNLGVMGWVVKTGAAIDLLAAVQAVCDGRQFVSAGLSGHHVTEAQAPTASSD